MSISPLEAANFSELAYINGGGPAPSGWVKLRASDEDNLGGHGYYGVAYVKLVDGVPVDLVIAHRGTEPTADDLLTDAWLGLGQRPQQVEDAKLFTAAVEQAFNQQYLETGVNVNDITTHTGHSLGGYLGILAAQDQSINSGVAVTAIGFDNPKTGIDPATLQADVTSYLNPPNLVNTAGAGVHVGTVFQIDNPPQFSNEQEGVTLANLLAIALDVALAAPNGLVQLANELFGWVPGVSFSSNLAVAPLSLAQTLGNHFLADITPKLGTAELVVNPQDWPSLPHGAIKHYLLGDYEQSGQLGGIAEILWEQQLSSIPNFALTQQQYADSLLAYINSPDFDFNSQEQHLMVGSGGTDIINGATGQDLVIMAGAGDDSIILDERGNDVIEGGDGKDTLSYENITTNDFVNVSLFDGTSFLNVGENDVPFGWQKKDVFDHIENLTGSKNGDVLQGNNETNVIKGLGGNDTIYGEGGNDILDGGGGNDLLFGDSGFDTYRFSDTGFGNDTITDDGGTIIIDMETTDPDTGEITVTSTKLSGKALKIGDDAFYTLYSGGIVYHLVGGGTGGPLVITPQDSTADSITITSFENGRFGIKLQEDGNEQPGTPPEGQPPLPSPTDNSDKAFADDMFDAATRPRPTRGRDPLVLDLDGDGVELTAMNNSAAYFDLDNDGIAEQVGWVSADDGLLAIDINGNGVIDNIDELFGNASVAGFVELAGFDSNADGEITSADAQFSDLLVWQDINGNGTSESGELKSLTEPGISSISLSTVDENYILQGNFVVETAEFIKAGLSYQIAEVLFTMDNEGGIVRTYSTAALNPETLLLPFSKGYGDVKPLHYAMSEDAVLLDMVRTANDNRLLKHAA